LASRAQNLSAMLETNAMHLPRARQTLIHGDFHPDQVWLHGDRVVFFDFDEFALGNPMEDLAEFIVKLEQQGGAATRRQSQVASLLAGYCAVAPRFFNAQWLQWHRAVQTLLQASRAFIYQQPDWRTLVDARLAASEQLASALLLKVAA
jgi:Ser/Thr protein kinase RdoA (MazF antagonist)